MVQRVDGVCISISFNFCTWYRVEIRFSGNPLQKSTIDDIIWLRKKQCVTDRLDIIFSITHVVQLMVSKSNLFCQGDIRRYPQRDIERKIPNFIPCQEVENGIGWLFLCDTWLRYLKLQFMLRETRQILNLRNQYVSKKILSDLVRKNVAGFSDKFFHFQYVTLEMFKGELNNYSILKLLFNQRPPFCNVL